MAVTANQPIKMQEGCRRSFPAAAAHIYQGTLVFLNASGYADDDTASGVNGFCGIAVAEVDNSNGSPGDLNVEVYTTGDFELVGAGTYTQADVGDIVYGDDNFTINTSIGSSSVPIGTCVGFVSGTKLMVRIRPCGDGALPIAALTTITHTAPGTPDYAVQDLINSSAYGFVTKDEGNTVLSVIKNLQQRVTDLEKRKA